MLCSSESTDVLHVLSVDKCMELPGYAFVLNCTADWLKLDATELRASHATRLHKILFAWLDYYACPAMVTSSVQDPSNAGSDSFMPAFCPKCSLSLHQIHQQDTLSAFNRFIA